MGAEGPYHAAMRTFLALPLLLAACGHGDRAMLADARGLAEDSPVFVSGAQVGKVGSVKVVEEGVEIGFEIGSEHSVALHRDACAMAVELRGTPSLIVVPGHEGVREGDAPLPQCRLPEDELRQVFEAFGGAFRGMLDQMMQGFAQGGAPFPGMPSMPMPTLPAMPGMPAMPGAPSPTIAGAPPAPPGASPSAAICAGIRIEVTGTEPFQSPLPGQPGGTRVRLRISNANATAVEVAGVAEATFMGPGRRALTRDSVPRPDVWFMPFTVPGAGSADTSVILADVDGHPPTVESVEVTVRAGPLDPTGCTARMH